MMRRSTRRHVREASSLQGAPSLPSPARGGGQGVADIRWKDAEEFSLMVSARRNLILEVRGLRKSFGGTEVLKGIDFAVEPQELVFIIGPSGAGKSTFLRCLNRLEEPTDGSISCIPRTISMPRAVVSAWCSRPSTSIPT